jgi:hypothetical protein
MHLHKFMKEYFVWGLETHNISPNVTCNYIKCKMLTIINRDWHLQCRLGYLKVYKLYVFVEADLFTRPGLKRRLRVSSWSPLTLFMRPPWARTRVSRRKWSWKGRGSTVCVRRPRRWRREKKRKEKKKLEKSGSGFFNKLRRCSVRDRTTPAGLTRPLWSTKCESWSESGPLESPLLQAYPRRWDLGHWSSVWMKQ